MSDEEVICEWMGWRGVWRVGSKVPINVYFDDLPICQCHNPEDAQRFVVAMNKLSLDRLHDVEARLTDEQWQQYREELCFAWQAMEPHYDLAKMYIHATAATKIAALAAVIRAEAK